jgi:hypothetical protein
MKNYWVSWYSRGAFEYHGPWWISGYDGNGLETFCAAVRADSETLAMQVITMSHDDNPFCFEWRFCEEKPENWAPFSGRFPRAEWMRWPMV